MLRLEGEGRKKKKDKKRRIGTASSPAAPCRAGRCRRELGSRTPAPVRGSQLQAQAASRRAPRSAELGPFLAGGCRGSRAAPAGGRGVPAPPSPPERAAAAAERLRRRTWKRSGAALVRPAPRPAGAKAGSRARRSARPSRRPSPRPRSAPRGEPGPQSPLEVCRSLGAGLPPSPAEPLRFTPKFRYNRNPGQHRLIKVVISLSTAKL